MVKVLIVDDMIILSECLRIAINQDPELDVVGCAADGKKAVEMSIELQPDIILMDLNMPVYSGNDAIIDIKRIKPEVKIIVLSVDVSERSITNAFINGADGYVLKNIAPKELIVTIKKAVAGERYIQDSAFHINRESASLIESNLPVKVEITDREMEVLELVMQGMTNDEIADYVGISTGRARNIVTNLITKYMVKNRTQLAVMAATLKLCKEWK
ncbi:MAG: response regulator [Solirubrobacterales bacterium]